MKSLKPRDLALDVLNRLDRNPSYSKRYLENALDQNPRLNERDRALVFHLVQGVLRWRLHLDWIIRGCLHFSFKKIEPSVLNILRLSVYQIFFMDRIPRSAAVNEAVKQAGYGGQRHVVSFVNGILREICRKRGQISFPDPEKDRLAYLCAYYSYPTWLVEKWLNEVGEDAIERLLAAGNCLPELVVRVNVLRLDRARLMQRLQDEGVSAMPTSHSPEGIRLEGFKGAVSRLRAFQEGLFQVQGEASQVCSRLLSPQPGERVLDICTGLGGKATYMAELMGNRGSILALDINRSRLMSLTETCIRLGVDCIQTVVADATSPVPVLPRHSFDKIMVDAPCSALGVLSKHPDGKWSRNGQDIKRLVRLQKDILSRTAPFLRKGGKMFYVTCTISREENEEVIHAFLGEHREMALENLALSAPEWGRDLIDEHGHLRAFPHVHGMDGFFGALMTKRVS